MVLSSLCYLSWTEFRGAGTIPTGYSLSLIVVLLSILFVFCSRAPSDIPKKAALQKNKLCGLEAQKVSGLCI